MLRVKPREGIKIRHPVTRQHIPADGIVLRELDTYWERRRMDGDVTVTEEPKGEEK